jgi:hypothetical protein
MGDLLQLFEELFALANAEASRISRARCVGQHKKRIVGLGARRSIGVPASCRWHQNTTSLFVDVPIELLVIFAT